MILYPAIDLKDGQCVRLLKGDMDAATVFGDDPAAQAQRFAQAGAKWLHLVALMGTIDRWRGAGFARVILGTVAVEDPVLVRAAAKAHPGKVAVGIDARAGKVATRGWAEETEVQVPDLARQFEDVGVAAIIYTDIDRDGAMGGPNIAATAALARAVSIPVIASGGVSRMGDLTALQATGIIAGAISGRALYDGAIDLAEALAALG